MTDKRKIAAAYIRRSSLNQIGNNSVEIQKRKLTDFFDRIGYHLPEEFIFIDDAVSAYKKTVTKRPAMIDMKKAVLEHDISAIGFYDFSRVDRKIYSFVSDFYYDVIQNKPYLKFYTADRLDEWSPTDLDVKLQLIIANAESNDKSRRAIDAQKKDLMGEIAKRPGSTVPFGYKQLDKRLIPDEETAPIVLFIFHLYSWGHSMENIASMLNEANIPAPKGKGWRTSTIENILKNQVYSGHLKWNLKHQLKDESLIEHTHQAIVPHVLYSLIEKIKEIKSQYFKLDTPFLFSNLVFCDTCGNALIHRNSSTKRKNVKYVYLKYQCKQCKYEVDATSLHHQLIEHIKPNFTSSMLVNREATMDKINNFTEALHIRLEQIEVKEQIISINEKQIIEHDLKHLFSVYRNVKQRIKTEKEEVQNSLAKLELLMNAKEIDTFLKRFQEVELEKLTNTEIRLLLLYFIDRVTINSNMQFKVNLKENPITLLTG